MYLDPNNFYGYAMYFLQHVELDLNKCTSNSLKGYFL